MNRHPVNRLTAETPVAQKLLNDIKNGDIRVQQIIDQHIVQPAGHKLRVFDLPPKYKPIKVARIHQNRDLDNGVNGLKGVTDSDHYHDVQKLPNQMVVVDLEDWNVMNGMTNARAKIPYKLRSKSEQPDYERTIDERLNPGMIAKKFGVDHMRQHNINADDSDPGIRVTKHQSVPKKQIGQNFRIANKQPPDARLGQYPLLPNPPSAAPNRLTLGKRMSPGQNTIAWDALWEHEKGYSQLLQSSYDVCKKYYGQGLPEAVCYAVVWLCIKNLRVMQLKTYRNTLRMLYPITDVDEKLLDHARQAYAIKNKHADNNTEKNEIAKLQDVYLKSFKDLAHIIARDFTGSDQKSRIAGLVDSVGQLSSLALDRINHYVKDCIYTLTKILASSPAPPAPHAAHMKELVVRHYLLMAVEKIQPLSWSKSNSYAQTAYKHFDFLQIQAMQAQPELFVQQYDEVAREILGSAGQTESLK